MLSPIRSSTRVLAAGVILLVAAACSSSGGGATNAPATVAPSAAPASVAPSTAPSEAPSSEPSVAGEVYTLTIVKDAKLGDFLAGEGGKTLYTFTPDTAPNKSTCNGDCATNWPALVLEDGATAVGAAGVSGTIATFARDDGSMQVSYNGKPVYYFAGDKAAGDTNGQGLADKWFVAKP